MVADKVIAFGKKERPEVQWQVNVIDDPKTVNAFATPGGYLYVYSGLILAADNEAELAGVMAHETGRVVARHSARQMVDAYGLQAISALVLGKNPGLLASLASGVGQKGFMLANSRSDETEADEYGARYAAAAGYDPHGLVTFFDKLRKREGSSPRILAILSDHPATPDRIRPRQRVHRPAPSERPRDQRRRLRPDEAARGGAQAERGAACGTAGPGPAELNRTYRPLAGSPPVPKLRFLHSRTAISHRGVHYVHS